MSDLTTDHTTRKRRRSYSSEFKTKVLAACDEPGKSIASVAREFSLNANLIHNWRKKHHGKAVDADFLRLPAPVLPVAYATAGSIRLELPGGIIVHWPIDRAADAIPWLRAIMP